jgi:quinol monooxygenase YgiN
MYLYQININIKPDKREAFVKNLNALSVRVRRQKDCLGHNLYQDSGGKNTYSVVGEWKTRPAMERHFRTSQFGEIISSARALGDTFVMNLVEASKTGGLELAREKIAAQEETKPDEE